MAPVQLVDQVVKVPAASKDVAEGLERFSASLQQALADGWQPGTDLPVILGAAVTDLGLKVQSYQKMIGEEAPEDPVGLAQAITNAALNVTRKLMGKL